MAVSVEIQPDRFKVTLSGRNVVYLLVAVAAVLAIIAVGRRSVLALLGCVLCGLLAWTLRRAKDFQTESLPFERGLVRNGPNEAVSHLGYRVRRFEEQLQYLEGTRVLTVPLAPKPIASPTQSLGFSEELSSRKSSFGQSSELEIVVSLPQPVRWDPPNEAVVIHPKQIEIICRRISFALMFLDLRR